MMITRVTSASRVAMIINRSLKPSSSLLSTQLEQKRSWPTIVGIPVTVKNATLKTITTSAALNRLDGNPKALVKLRKYRPHSSSGRNQLSFKRFDSCYRQLYPCKRTKPLQNSNRSKSVKKSSSSRCHENSTRSLDNFQKSQSATSFFWPPIYRCKHKPLPKPDESPGVNANSKLPSWLLPLYECKTAKPAEIEGHQKTMYSGIAFHRKMEFNESMKQIKLKQNSLNHELMEKWSLYYVGTEKKNKNKLREKSSARLLMAVDDLKKRIGKMHERNKTFKPNSYRMTSAQRSNSEYDEIYLGVELNSKDGDSLGREQKSKNVVTKQPDDSKDMSSSKRVQAVVMGHSHNSMAPQKLKASQNLKAINQTKNGDRLCADESDTNSVLDQKESMRFVKKNGNGSWDSQHNSKDETAVPDLDPSKLKERIEQWKLKNKEMTKVLADNPRVSEKTVPYKETYLDETEQHLPQEYNKMEENTSDTSKSVIVCETVNQIGKRSMSSFPTFRVIPHKELSKGPLVVIKRNFNSSPKHFQGKGSWFDSFMLIRKPNSSKKDESGSTETGKLADHPQTSCGEPEKCAHVDSSRSPCSLKISEAEHRSKNEIGVVDLNGTSSADNNPSLHDVLKKLKKAETMVNNKPWPKDSRIRKVDSKTPPHASILPPSNSSDLKDQKNISGYQWVSNNKEALEGMKQKSHRPLVPEHVKVSIQEFKLPLKAQIADYRKRVDNKRRPHLISHRRYSTCGSRMLFSSNIVSKAKTMSSKNMFTISSRFLNTSVISNATSKRNPSSRGKSDPEILISSDLYKQYVLRPIYESRPKKDNRNLRTRLKVVSNSVDLPTNGNTQSKICTGLTSPNLATKTFFPDVRPRSMKKQVEELKCLIKKNKALNHVIKGPNMPRASQQNENYQQRLKRLVRAAEESAKNMEIPPPRRASGPFPKPTTNHQTLSKLAVNNEADMQKIQSQQRVSKIKLDSDDSSDTCVEPNVSKRKQPFLNLIFRLKSVVDFVGRRAIPPTKGLNSEEQSELKSKGDLNSSVSAQDLKMSGLSHNIQLNAEPKVFSDSFKLSSEKIEKAKSEFDTTAKNKLGSRKETPHLANPLKSLVHKNPERTEVSGICEKINGGLNILRSMSTPVLGNARESNNHPVKPSLGSTSSIKPKTSAEPSQGSHLKTSASYVMSNVSPASDVNGSILQKAHQNLRSTKSQQKDLQIPKLNDRAGEKMKLETCEDPYRRTSPSKLETAPVSQKVEQVSLASESEIDSKFNQSTPQRYSSNQDPVKAVAEKKPPDIEQSQEVVKTSLNSLGYVQDGLEQMQGRQDSIPEPNRMKSTTDDPEQAGKNLSSSNFQSSKVSKMFADLSRDTTSSPQSVKTSPPSQDQQTPPSNGFETTNCDRSQVVAESPNEACHDNVSILTDQYPDVQYMSCPDCGRIYPIYCACGSLQDFSAPPNAGSSSHSNPTSNSSFLSRYFPAEHPVNQSCYPRDENISNQPIFSHEMQGDYGTSDRNLEQQTTPSGSFKRENLNEGVPYVRRKDGYLELLDKEPFINSDILKKLKLPLNIDEELKETTWYNATGIIPR